MNSYSEISKKSSDDDNLDTLHGLKKMINKYQFDNMKLDHQISILIGKVNQEKQTKKQQYRYCEYKGGYIEPMVIVSSIRKKR